MDKKNKISENTLVVPEKTLNSSNVQTYVKKNPKTNVVTVDDATAKKLATTQTAAQTNSNVSGSGIMEENGESVNEIDAIIEPQDNATIKYLSNVQDKTTGEVSKPFVIGGKNYRMIRGVYPDKSINQAVYCLDADEMGQNKIYSVEDFEKEIATPFLLSQLDEPENEVPQPSIDPNWSNVPTPELDYLNLNDLGGYKHFFVNSLTGEIPAKFKTIKEMMRSGIALGENEEYMDGKTLKQFRFKNNFFKENDAISEGVSEGVNDENEGVKSNINRLTKMIKDRFSSEFSKLTNEKDQTDFINAMRKELKLNENRKIITKKDLIESLKK